MKTEKYNAYEEKYYIQYIETETKEKIIMRLPFKCTLQTIICALCSVINVQFYHRDFSVVFQFFFKKYFYFKFFLTS